MEPLKTLSREIAPQIEGVFFDIDDTLFFAQQDFAPGVPGAVGLKNAVFKLAPITGRPAGWCDHIARMWPVDAVVGEKGSFYSKCE